MSEAEIPENVDPETGEVLSEQDVAEAEEAESEDPSPDTDSDEPGQETVAAVDESAPEDSGETSEPGLTEADVEKNTKAMNRAADVYIKKVVATLGADLSGMQTCPLCADSWPGVRFPAMPSPENLAAVRVAIGLEPGDNLPKDPYSKRCPTCDGWCYTDSGSRGAGKGRLECWDCGGAGWVPVGDERQGGRILAGNGHTTLPAVGPPAVSSNDPPEVESLRQLGYVVVAPIAPVEVPQG